MSVFSFLVNKVMFVFQRQFTNLVPVGTKFQFELAMNKCILLYVSICVYLHIILNLQYSLLAFSCSDLYFLIGFNAA